MSSTETRALRYWRVQPEGNAWSALAADDDLNARYLLHDYEEVFVFTATELDQIKAQAAATALREAVAAFGDSVWVDLIRPGGARTMNINANSVMGWLIDRADDLTPEGSTD